MATIANESEHEKLASFALHGLHIQAIQRTLVIDASVKLVGVELSLYRPSTMECLKMLHTPRGNNMDQYLFSIKYCNVKL